MPLAQKFLSCFDDAMFAACGRVLFEKLGVHDAIVQKLSETIACTDQGRSFPFRRFFVRMLYVRINQPSWYMQIVYFFLPPPCKKSPLQIAIV